MTRWGQRAMAAGLAGAALVCGANRLAASTWITMGNLAGARAAQCAVLLNDGRVLVTGGGSGFLATSEIFNPATGAWTGAASLITQRNQPAAALLPDGRVLVAGGFTGPPLTPTPRSE